MPRSFLTRFASPLQSSGSLSSRRFWLLLLWKNMWLLYAFRRRILPVPVILNRFAAVFDVFSLFPIVASFFRCGRLFVRADHERHLLAFEACGLIDLDRIA